jgi:hypothetical protein
MKLKPWIHSALHIGCVALRFYYRVIAFGNYGEK